MCPNTVNVCFYQIEEGKITLTECKKHRINRTDVGGYETTYLHRSHLESQNKD